MTSDPSTARVVVVMGVSGAGKSTIGRALARRWGVDFVEGDDFHPTSNVERMRAGEPLTEDQRGPWLDAIAEDVARHHAEGRAAVIACSALRRQHRDRLRRGGPVSFVFLDADHDELRRRVDDRDHDYMPATLLDSQLDVLEPPGDEDDAVHVVPTGDIETTVDRVVEALAAG
ncbi:MAG: gluconokinase [Acidimicrobiales bacterium]